MAKNFGKNKIKRQVGRPTDARRKHKKRKQINGQKSLQYKGPETKTTNLTQEAELK